MNTCQHGNDEHKCSLCVELEEEAKWDRERYINLVEDLFVEMSPRAFDFDRSDIAPTTILGMATQLANVFTAWAIKVRDE